MELFAVYDECVGATGWLWKVVDLLQGVTNQLLFWLVLYPPSLRGNVGPPEAPSSSTKAVAAAVSRF